MLQLLSTNWCAACKSLKEFLGKNNVEFVERDIDNDPDAYKIVTTLGLRTIPVLYKDDKNYVVGFDIAKVRNLIKNQ